MSIDLAQRLRDYACDYTSTTHHDALINEAADEIESLRQQLETERVRLAACGVVAMANTPESAAKAREMLPQYRSASRDDVAAAVDREMALREQVSTVTQAVGLATTIKGDMEIDVTDPIGMMQHVVAYVESLRQQLALAFEAGRVVEREECAKVCVDERLEDAELDVYMVYNMAVKHCVNAIRARSTKAP